MKKIIIVILLILINVSCVYAQDVVKLVAPMLKEFYIEYNTVCAKNIKPDDLIKQLDSLKRKYCSQSFQKELKKMFKIHGLDHDVLINDVYTEDLKSLKTISVTKDDTRKNCYYVSYIAVVTGMGNKKTNEKVQIHLVVIKENVLLKIDNVLDN